MDGTPQIETSGIEGDIFVIANIHRARYLINSKTSWGTKEKTTLLRVYVHTEKETGFRTERQAWAASHVPMGTLGAYPCPG
jgi:hypothetical protein